MWITLTQEDYNALHEPSQEWLNYVEDMETWVVMLLNKLPEDLDLALQIILTEQPAPLPPNKR